jgi:Reverse transcriptase (RNA-dependent DNA polymerase)
MHDREKSDRLVVPTNPPNNPAQAGAEAGEGRGLPEGNTASETRPGRGAGQGVSSDLERVRQVARRDRDVRFTALLYHVTVDRLREAYRAISPDAAAGVDGVTWRDYGSDLEANLVDLHARVQRGAYRARPSRRVFIPKPDGWLRPLGVASVEDKVLQRAVVEVLNAVYEEDFVGFSYGFRPGRSQHDALDALAVGIARKKVNFVLDADISDFFTGLERRGDRKPETFEFLGLTHVCAKDRHGRFKLKRVTSKKKMRSKLHAVKAEMRRRMHHPIPEQGRWLARVLQGHYNYYAVPDNSEALHGFRRRVIRLWLQALRRRSQKDRLTWKRMSRLADRWLPTPRILHPWPDRRFDARTQGRSPVR